MRFARLFRRLRGSRDGAGPERFPDAGHFARSRGIAGFKKIFGATEVVDAVAALAGSMEAGGEAPRVLELGSGEGRVLLELAQRFPGVLLHGLNKEPWPAMQGTESLRGIAAASGLFTSDELERLVLPEMHFNDAKRLEFPDAHFDLVVSQVSIEHMRRKDRVLQEVWRVLRPGGTALLEVDARLPEMPPEVAGETPRFVVRHHGGDRSLFELIEEVAARGFSLELSEKGKKVHRIGLRMKKNIDRPLDLGLELSERESVRLAKFRDDKHVRGGSPWWGFRSVFRPRASSGERAPE